MKQIWQNCLLKDFKIYVSKLIKANMMPNQFVTNNYDRYWSVTLTMGEVK